MLLAAADDRGCDPARAPGPVRRARPAGLAHQVRQGAADGRRRRVLRLRPAEGGRPRFRYPDQDEPRPQLRHAVLARVDQLPPGPEPESGQLREHLRAIAVEPCCGQSADVLQQHGSRAYLRDQPQRLREQVALVGVTELPARDRERRAGHAPCEQVGAAEAAPVDVGNVVFDDLPVVAPIEPQRLAGVRVDFNGRGVAEARLLEPERLAARARADLQDGQLAHASSGSRHRPDSAGQRPGGGVPTPDCRFWPGPGALARRIRRCSSAAGR